MNDDGADIAKREVEIQDKGLKDELKILLDEQQEGQKNLTGNLTEDFAYTIVNTPRINELKNRVIGRMFKLIQAYENYTRILEHRVGK